ncbi:PHP domain-containing protein [bacterium]|nr:PHP domain-containing protein [bacterium]
MAIPYDCHTHTTFSDGRNSVEENVRQAEAMGLELVVISDHLWPDTDDLSTHVQRIVAADAESPIHVVPGLEVTVQDSMGTVPLTDRDASLVRFVLADIGGCTRGVAIDPPADVDRYLSNIFRTTLAMVENPLVHALAHPFNLGRFPATVTPAQLPRSGLREVGAALFEADKAFEIMNQMSWWYPDMSERQFTLEYAELLAVMAEQNAKFVLGSDAHSCGAVGAQGWCRRVMELAGIEKSQVVDLPRKFSDRHPPVR